MANLPLKPVAWLHDERPDSDAITDRVKEIWLRAWPKQVEHYTIPLYRRESLEEEAKALAEGAAYMARSLGL